MAAPHGPHTSAPASRDVSVRELFWKIFAALAHSLACDYHNDVLFQKRSSPCGFGKRGGGFLGMAASEERREHGIWQELRALANLYPDTRGQLATEVGISPSALSNLESGRRWPSEEITLKLAAALDVPVHMLARRDEAEEAAS
jgi:DNA-binding XRE family transcriptional regulator